MNSTKVNTISERYSSRYNRGFLRMLKHDGQSETNKYIDQFYSSQDYQGRLEAITYLINAFGKHEIPIEIFTDALNDFCSQVKLYVLKNFDFSSENSTEIKLCLVNIAQNDEKLQLRALALEKLSELFPNGNYDLFFSTSLLKSSKESAAGLKGLYNLDKEKAYQMAKFRAETSTGNLDIAIGEIFQLQGNIEDLDFFRIRLEARTKFNKIELIHIYLKMLGKIENPPTIKSHLHFICENILKTTNTELIQLLIMELHNFISEHNDLLERNYELLEFVNNTINQLLGKNYMKNKNIDPFGPL